jgi:hypothetical protein
MMRRRAVIVAGLVSVLLAGALACTGDQPAPQPSPSLEDDGFVRGSVAPDGGQVRVVESGYTVVADLRGMATFGAVLENTSKDRAVSVTVTARFFDSAGGDVQFGSYISSLNSEPARILPGERVGVGDQLLGWETRNDSRTPARMELEVMADTWWPVARVARVVVSDVRPETESDGDRILSFTVDSGLALSAGEQRTVVIVRDRAGKVVGGLIPLRPQEPWPVGRSPQRVVLERRAVPAGADLSRAEVFVGNTDLRR